MTPFTARGGDLPVFDHLPLEDAEPGVVHRGWLNLAEDGLGQPIQAPVLLARGKKPGPVLGICAAVHGDEVNGVRVIHELFQRLEPRKLRGTVVGLPVVHTPAFHHHMRRSPEGDDLNHHFPGKPDGNSVQAYAHRVMTRFVEPLDVLIDLHTASRGRANCLYVRADMTNDVTAQMAYLQRPQILLHNPPSDGTLRGAADDHGVPAITVEIGNPSRFQQEYIRRSIRGVFSVLAHREMVARRPLAPGPPPVLCANSQWLFTDRGGFLEVFPAVAEKVEGGQEIARLVDAFGRHVRTYTAPHDGIVIGRAVNPVAATGARILHLGRIAPDTHDFVPRDARSLQILARPSAAKAVSHD